MRKTSFYHYSIDGFQTNPNNAEVLDILYGAGKIPLSIFKKDAGRFMEAIISPEERQERGIERINDGEEVETLNRLLKGRAMILLTNCENYLEYTSSIQNGIKEVAGLRIGGHIDLAESFNYASCKPGYEDLYSSTR